MELGYSRKLKFMSGCYAVFHKQLGDLVLLQPALAKLCQHHGAPVECMTRTGHGPLLQLMPGVRFRRGVPLAYRRHLYCFDLSQQNRWRWGEADLEERNLAAKIRR
jgi:hypothetical protein